MSISITMSRPSVEALRAMLAAELFVPGDPGYDRARRAWDLAVDRRPAVVVFAASAVDVARAVRFARSQGMRIAPQGTGRGQAGARWGDVAAPAGNDGLAALAGTSPNVGVTGYTLGGGVGWLPRRYGLAANSVTAVEIVTPDGRLARADADHEPELLWAVRAGGGSVGVISALEMALYPVSKVHAGARFFPIERSSDVLHGWPNWTDTVPDELTSRARLPRLPAGAEVPAVLRGRAFAVVEATYVGDSRHGAWRDRSDARARPRARHIPHSPGPGVRAAEYAHGNSDAGDRGRRVPRRPPGRRGRHDPSAGWTRRRRIASEHRDPASRGRARARSRRRRYQPKIEAKYAILASGIGPNPELYDAYECASEPSGTRSLRGTQATTTATSSMPPPKLNSCCWPPPTSNSRKSRPGMTRIRR
jgi:FAD/FMN-containing dehydrogenase